MKIMNFKRCSFYARHQGETSGPSATYIKISSIQLIIKNTEI